jgi:hypothetical protein
MPNGFRLDQSRLSVVSTTLGTLSELVFPSSHFQYHWIGVSGQAYNQLRVTNMRGDPVCILRVGYVTNRSPESAGLVYVCSFKLHGELEQQFNTIRCMAYNLCWSFISRGHAEKTVLDRTLSLSRYLMATWGRDECMYSLDHEDVRLLSCLREVGGGNFNAIFNDRSKFPEFLASKMKTLVTQMEKVVAAFEQRFITTWDDPTITLQISPEECYSLTYDLSVDKPFRSGMRTWVLYDVKSGTEVVTFCSIERMVGYVFARVKRLELCCLFQDKMKLHSSPKRRNSETNGGDDVPGPELGIERSDEVQIEGPAVEDGSGEPP